VYLEDPVRYPSEKRVRNAAERIGGADDNQDGGSASSFKPVRTQTIRMLRQPR